MYIKLFCCICVFLHYYWSLKLFTIESSYSDTVTGQNADTNKLLNEYSGLRRNIYQPFQDSWDITEEEVERTQEREKRI